MAAVSAVKHVPGHPACFGVSFHKGLDIDHGFGRQFLKYPFNELGDAEEGEGSSQESLHGHLVGGIEDGRGVAAGAQGGEGQGEAAEGFGIGLLEVEAGVGGEIQRGHPPASIRSGRGQRAGDGRAHVGVAQLRQHRAPST